jgi:peptidoglycan/xylan/chitin deacetylase (PgdA/CDA1 family)
MTDVTSNIRWPAGHRAALSVIIHVAGLGLDSESTPTPGLVGVDYTVTGLQRLLDTLADLDVPATAAFTTEAANSAPQLLRRAVELGHEVAASACAATASTPDLIDTIKSLTGAPVEGLIEQLPGLPSADQDDVFGSDSGNAWRITGTSGDLPISVRDPNATIIPTSPYSIDMTWLSPSGPQPPSSMLEAWSLSLAAHRTEGTFMPIVLHPHIAGRPGFVGTVSRFLDEVIATGDVWIARLDHVARAWHELSPNSQES